MINDMIPKTQFLLFLHFSILTKNSVNLKNKKGTRFLLCLHSSNLKPLALFMIQNKVPICEYCHNNDPEHHQ